MSDPTNEGDAERFTLAMSIFDAVCDLPEVERSAEIARRCDGDTQLETEVLSLLKHDADVDDRVEAIEDGHGIEAAARGVLESFQQESPVQIDGYSLLGEIGRGGMGVIYRARQASPDRTVALKVLRPGFVSSEIIRRFSRESQVLGRLRHPGIAQIFEAGEASSATGRAPFFSMELVEGVPIDRHAEAESLDRRQRLELLARVCDAVGHANDLGIIHRDLKPANILVERASGDAIGQPKVLDFGIARITDPSFEVTTIQTQVGEIIGTIAYMSPEQVAGQPDSLDARCDVYALGVIGYELLTGRRPLELSSLPVPEAARVIRDDDPEPLTTHDKSLAGDIATIVAKAMEKDKNRRYPTAGALAADLRRYLADIPIEARPASTIYQVRKFAQRNKGVVGGVVATFVMLAVALIGTSYGLLQAQSQRDYALRAQQETDTVAEFQARQFSDNSAEEMGYQNRTSFLNSLTEESRAVIEPRLGEVNFTDLALDTMHQNLFEPSYLVIEQQFTESPAVRARLLQSLASTLTEIGMFDEAVEPQRTAVEIREDIFGSSHPATLESVHAQATLAREQGDYDTALLLYQRVLEEREQTLGTQNPDTIAAMVSVAETLGLQQDYERGRQTGERALTLALDNLGELHEVTIEARAAAGLSTYSLGLAKESEAIFRKVYEDSITVLGPEHPRTLLAMEDLCRQLIDLGKIEEAEELIVRAMDMRGRVYGENHQSVTRQLGVLASLYEIQGRFSESSDLERQKYEKYVRFYGEEHPTTLVSANNYATSLDRLGRYAEAEAIHRKLLEIRLRIHEPDHLSTMMTYGNLAYVVEAQGRTDEALDLHRRSMEGLRRSQGDDNPNTLVAVQNFGTLLARTGALDDAEPYYLEAYEGRRRVLGDDSLSTLNSVYNLGNLLILQGKLDEAEPYCVAALDGYRRVGGEDHIGTIYSFGLVGDLRSEQGRVEESEAMYRERYERSLRIMGDDHPMTHSSIEMLAGVLEELGRVNEADELRAKVPASDPQG